MRFLILMTLSFCTAFANQATAAGLVSLHEMAQRPASLQERLFRQLESPEAKQRMLAMGLSPKEARDRLAALSESELRELASRAGAPEVGGDIVISLTTILLIVIIVLLLR